MKAGPIETGESSRDATQPRGGNRGMSILDLILRMVAIIGTLGSAVAMGTTSETVPVFIQFIQIRVQYNDFPTFTFFVVANSIVSGYLFLSLPLSVFHFIRSAAKITRIILVIFDTVMLAFLSTGASAATAIVYLAHKGNATANWTAICQQLDNFCERTSGSLIGSFLAIIALVLIVITSAVALSRC